MHILPSFLFSISANIDNFTVGLAYGIKNIKIKLLSNLIIAFISSIGTFISMYMGFLISKLILPKVANILGCTILIVIGTWFIADSFREKDNHPKSKLNKRNDIKTYEQLLDNPTIADADNSGSIDIKESITLAISLTLNNLGLGIGASITGISILFTTFFTFIVSILSISLGYFIGKSFLSKLLGKYAIIASGGIIIFLGVYELIS